VSHTCGDVTPLAGSYSGEGGAGSDDEDGDDDDDDAENSTQREVKQVMVQSGIDTVVERKSLKRLAALFAHPGATTASPIGGGAALSKRR
jgi:hypothetical protein